MRIMQEQDRRFVNLEKKIGLFIVAAITGLVLVVALIGIQQEVFVSKAEIFFIADTGRDLIEGQAVKFKGFRIGKVEKVSLNDEAQVVVTLSINENYMKWIKTDSKARLVRENVVGDNIIEITGGSDEAPPIKDEGTITFERAKGINELFEDLKGEIELTLTDITEIIHYVNDPKGDIKRTLANMRVLTGELIHTRENLDNFINNADGNLEETLSGIDEVVGSMKNGVMPELRAVLDSADRTLEGTERVMGKLYENLPDMIDSATRSLQNIEKITGDIKRTTPALPPIVERGGELIDSSREVVDSLKDVWPISPGIKKPREKTLDVDSYE